MSNPGLFAGNVCRFLVPQAPGKGHGDQHGHAQEVAAYKEQEGEEEVSEGVWVCSAHVSGSSVGGLLSTLTY